MNQTPNGSPARTEHEATQDRIIGQIEKHGQKAALEPRTFGDKAGSENDLINELSTRTANGVLDVEDVWRSYKNTPHAPVSMLGKYIVHRIENAADYDDPGRATLLDAAFINLHRYGDAGTHNSHIEPAHLHAAILKNPNLISGMLRCRDDIHNLIRRGVGLNVQKIDGKDYVALTRGLASDVMTDEHALSSFADTQDTGFGGIMHHAWVPLDDIWYSFDLGPKRAAGSFGPENEFVVGKKGTRYEAKREDVKRQRFTKGHLLDNSESDYGYLLDDSTDGDILAKLKEHVETPEKSNFQYEHLVSLLKRQNLSRPILQYMLDNNIGTEQVLAHPGTSYDMIVKSLQKAGPGVVWFLMQAAMDNPNLADKEREQVVDSYFDPPALYPKLYKWAGTNTRNKVIQKVLGLKGTKRETAAFNLLRDAGEHLSPEHVDQLVDLVADRSPAIRQCHVTNKVFANIMQLASEGKDRLVGEALKNPNLTDEQMALLTLHVPNIGRIFVDRVAADSYDAVNYKQIPPALANAVLDEADRRGNRVNFFDLFSGGGFSPGTKIMKRKDIYRWFLTHVSDRPPALEKRLIMGLADSPESLVRLAQGTKNLSTLQALLPQELFPSGVSEASLRALWRRAWHQLESIRQTNTGWDVDHNQSTDRMGRIVVRMAALKRLLEAYEGGKITRGRHIIQPRKAA